MGTKQISNDVLFVFVGKPGHYIDYCVGVRQCVGIQTE